MEKVIWVLGLSIASAIAYSVAGRGGFKHAKLIRRLGCPLLVLGLFWALKGFFWGFWWAYLLTYGLMVGAISAYWSELQAPDDDVSALEWTVTGFCYGLAAFPLIWAGVHWWLIIARAIILAILTALWSNNISNATVEELGRGFIFCASVPLLLI